jgi:hypothetical protein
MAAALAINQLNFASAIKSYYLLQNALAIGDFLSLFE